MDSESSSKSPETAIISLGAGSGFPKRDFHRMSFQSAEINLEMLHLSGNGRRFPYFRFGVPQGLEAINFGEWNATSRHPERNTFGKIGKATMKYLLQPEVMRNMEEAAKILIKQHRRASSARIRSKVQRESSASSKDFFFVQPQRCPERYGREKLLEELDY